MHGRLRSALRAALAGALVAGCASNPALREARRIVDRAQPLRCAILAMEAAHARAPAAGVAAARLKARVADARRMLKVHYLATMDEYIAVMKRLTFEERKSIYRYSDTAAERCGAEAEDRAR